MVTVMYQQQLTTVHGDEVHLAQVFTTDTMQRPLTASLTKMKQRVPSPTTTTREGTFWAVGDDTRHTTTAGIQEPPH